MDEEERKIEMDDCVDTSLASEGTDLFVDFRRRSFVSRTQNDTVVSWITLRGVIKVY